MIETRTINYTIPTTKSDILVKQWIEILKLHKQKIEDREFYERKMINIICELSYSDIMSLPTHEYSTIVDYLNKIIGTKSELIKTFKFKNVEYGLIPDFGKYLTLSERIDLDGYLDSEDYSRLLSILYRPITYKDGDKYRIEPYESTHTLFDDLSYEVLDGVLGFFLTIYNKLQKTILQYSMKEMKKMKNLDLDCLKNLNSFLNGEDGQN